MYWSEYPTGMEKIFFPDRFDKSFLKFANFFVFGREGFEIFKKSNVGATETARFIYLGPELWVT